MLHQKPDVAGLSKAGQHFYSCGLSGLWCSAFAQLYVRCLVLLQREQHAVSHPFDPCAPVEVLLQLVQPLLHLSVGEVCVAVVLAGRNLWTLG